MDVSRFNSEGKLTLALARNEALFFQLRVSPTGAPPASARLYPSVSRLASLAGVGA